MESRFRKAAMWSVLVVLMGASTLTAAAQRRGARPEVTLPRGPVRSIILGSCAQCHGIDDFAYNALDRTGWDAVIERMKTTRSGVIERAVISDEDKEILLDWLVARFGPDSTPFPREYVPRELTEDELLSDAEATSLLTMTCASCHSLERVEEGNRSEQQWRNTLLAMIGRGARLAIDDVEPLVKWLASTERTNEAN